MPQTKTPFPHSKQDLQLTVRKREGQLQPFFLERITQALLRAFKDVYEVPPQQELSSAHTTAIQTMSQRIEEKVAEEAKESKATSVEFIQDLVEEVLMDHGFHKVARSYILYRERHRQMRIQRQQTTPLLHDPLVLLPDGNSVPFSTLHIQELIEDACHVDPLCSSKEIYEEVLKGLYDKVPLAEVQRSLLLATRTRFEVDPAYRFVAARLLLAEIYRDTFGPAVGLSPSHEEYQEGFVRAIQEGVRHEQLSAELLTFSLESIAQALQKERDTLFAYIGIQTLHDRYLLKHHERCIETPQYFWMRVAMGLALHEGEKKEKHALAFYEMLSSLRVVSSTPTLFHAGTKHPQLSSCYLSTIRDDLDHIFKVFGDNARLAKWSGGIGNDWSAVRSTGAPIKGTNVNSQGLIPFLKIANDIAIAINRSGKRRGAVCAYLETWHLDVEEFLELRKNTGDERRRIHDMNTANWIPDLFIKRVLDDAEWTLFSPSDVPDLHDLYGTAFERRYCEYESLVAKGQLKRYKKINALQLWRKMLTMLFETGHPWITFKDPSNLRSMQQHTGVVHSSNLCTEILLNTSEQETAVCNLASVNLASHVNDEGLDKEKLAETVHVAMRMLDNVVDLNFYPTPEAKQSNLRHRPVGLGMMGFQDALYRLRIPYDSDAAVEFADASTEAMSYYALLSSAQLAEEKGPYSSFKGSLWDQGYLPIDTLRLLKEERRENLDVDESMKMDWGPVREAIRRYGLRNSHTMAIAPTATIANIAGVSQSIEPLYSHLYVKSNLSGDFLVLNSYLVEDLKKLQLWDAEMVDDLKYTDGSLQEIERIPDDLKALYKTAFEIDPHWLIACASRRQKWIDMGQSLNLYLAAPSGKQLHEMYIEAWKRGLKTTYYLRSLGATKVEKSNQDINRRGIQPRWMKNSSASSTLSVTRQNDACSLNDEDCESCQ